MGGSADSIGGNTATECRQHSDRVQATQPQQLGTGNSFNTGSMRQAAADCAAAGGTGSAHLKTQAPPSLHDPGICATLDGRPSGGQQLAPLPAALVLLASRSPCCLTAPQVGDSRVQEVAVEGHKDRAQGLSQGAHQVEQGGLPPQGQCLCRQGPWRRSGAICSCSCSLKLEALPDECSQPPRHGQGWCRNMQQEPAHRWEALGGGGGGGWGGGGVGTRLLACGSRRQAVPRLRPDCAPVLPACAVLAQSSSRRKRGWNLASLSFMVKATKAPAVDRTCHTLAAPGCPAESGSGKA